jgi:lambda family phage minor tail protein L
MQTLPPVIVQEKNKLATPSAWLVLLDILLSDTLTLHLCSNTENVTFKGHVYEAFPFNLEPAKQTAQGEIPSVTLKVANVTQLIQGYLEDLDGAVGTTVIVRVVNSAYLSEDYSELEMTFGVLGSEADAEWVSFTLGLPNPLKRRYPLHRYMASHCNWIFKGAECAYTGTRAICDRSFDTCDKVMLNSRRFGGHRGLSQKGWRIV